MEERDTSGNKTDGPMSDVTGQQARVDVIISMHVFNPSRLKSERKERFYQYPVNIPLYARTPAQK